MRKIDLLVIPKQVDALNVNAHLSIENLKAILLLVEVCDDPRERV